MTIPVVSVENHLILASFEKSSFRYNPWNILTFCDNSVRRDQKCPLRQYLSSNLDKIEWLDWTSERQRNEWRDCDKIKNLFRLFNLLIKKFLFRIRIFNLSISIFICAISKVKIQTGCTITEIFFAEILFLLVWKWEWFCSNTVDSLKQDTQPCRKNL